MGCRALAINPKATAVAMTSDVVITRNVGTVPPSSLDTLRALEQLQL
jgi:hypothetical protein